MHAVSPVFLLDPMPRSPAPAASASTRHRFVAHLQSEVPGLALVYLFGSAAGGSARAASDLDVAFLADAAPAPMQRFRVQEDLARVLGRDVDLVDLRAASTVMRAEVLRTGRVLFERSRPERDRFEMHTCSAYALLNEERHGILDDIRRRGSIYKKQTGDHAE
jgi:predicted nucleotidyltransferase